MPSDGAVDLYLRWDANPPYEGYSKCFANGVPPKQAAVLFAEQRPGAAAQFSEPSGEPAWKTIPLALQEMFTKRAGANVSRVEAGHLSLITCPAEVTEVILSAAKASAGAAEPVGAGAAG